jgi:hypothetical protein
MLELSRMSQADAQHTLEVYHWTMTHLDEITAIARDAERAGVSVASVQERFHQVYTELESTRFLPVTISLFTDQDALEQGSQTEPQFALCRPLDEFTEVAYVGWLQTLDLSEVVARFGIRGDDPTWRFGAESANSVAGMRWGT